MFFKLHYIFEVNLVLVQNSENLTKILTRKTRLKNDQFFVIFGYLIHS